MCILDAVWYIGVMIFHIAGDSRWNYRAGVCVPLIVEFCIRIAGFEVPVSENEYTSLVYILCPSPQPRSKQSTSFILSSYSPSLEQAGNFHVQLL
jgi:hypothetical protein